MAKSMEETSKFLDEVTEELDGSEIAEEALEATDEFEEDATTEEEVAETSEDEEAEGAEEKETPEEEPAEKPEGEGEPPETVPLATFLEKKKDYKEEIAELRGQVNTLTLLSQQVKTGTEELSPIQQAMKEQKVKNIEDLELSPGEALALQSEESKFQAKQQEKQQKNVLPENELGTAQEKALIAASVTMSDAKMGKGLGIETITELGIPLLSQAEKNYLDQVDPKDFAKEVYLFCERAIERQGGSMAEALAQTKKIAQKTRPKGKRPKGPKPPSDNRRSRDDYQGPHSDIVDHIFR